MLSEDSSDSEVDDNPVHQLTINEHYAKAYAYKKEREELAKLKEKYGSEAEDVENDESEDSEEDESEDENGEELTPAVDAAILRTLARIKRKDPAIYEADKSIFQEEQRKTKEKPVMSRAVKEKSKPITIRQHALASALDTNSRSPSPEPETHVEEQRRLRDETISAFHTALSRDDEDGDDDDELLVPREKTKDEVEREEEEYRAYLEREVAEDIEALVTVEEDTVGVRQTPAEVAEEENVSKAKKKKKSKGKEKEKKQETDQEFLMNYILNRGWIDRSARHVPTYSEVTHSRSKAAQEETGAEPNDDPVQEGRDERGGEGDDDDENSLLEDDDEFEEVAEQFETSYNFRFEEPDAAIIPAHPRHLPSLVRREDTTRKEAREKRKARKEEELLKKKEEMRRLRALKMKDLRAKLERIGREGGKNLEDDALAELNLDADWDPDAHDKQMMGIFGGDGEYDANFDTEKPQWDDDIDIDDIVPPASTSKANKKKKKKKKKSGDDDEAVEGVDVNAMDADADPPEDDEEWDGTEEMRKRKLEEYMDEIYGMEFNDLVGDLPTRFKYTPVAPQSYALTPAEILLATDAELNQYMGVKKYAPYRKDGKWDHTRGERLKELKDKLASRSLAGMQDAGETEAERPAKKRKGKKERQKLKVATIANAYQSGTTGADADDDRGADGLEESTGQKRRATAESPEDSGDVQPKKKKRRQKKTAVA